MEPKTPRIKEIMSKMHSWIANQNPVIVPEVEIPSKPAGCTGEGALVKRGHLNASVQSVREFREWWKVTRPAVQ
jgi:hypothetical protein